MENKILQLKKEKNAVILAHYYAPDEVQKVADFVGDSFYLARVAKKSTADLLVFCGVSFMGESAKILNQGKKVLMPDLSADCPMAHMVQDGMIEKMRQQYEDLAVVCYINSTAQLKCESDVCVTSSNAVQIVRELPNKNIFFIPDKNLGSYVAKMVPEKNVLLNDGCCPIHDSITKEQVLLEKEQHKNAVILAHPECKEEVLAMADYIGSTAGIIEFAGKSQDTEFIICTEKGVLHQLKKENPKKSFYFMQQGSCCPDMKQNTLEKVYHCLFAEENEVKVSKEICQKAVLPLDRMLSLAK